MGQERIVPFLSFPFRTNIALIFLLFSGFSYAQNIGINGDGSTPESNTMLDIKSTGNTSATFGLKVKDSGANDQFVVRNDGNVGIGTNTPSKTIDIDGGIAYREGTALSLSNGVNSNIAIGDHSFYRITGPTNNFSITGFTGGTDGEILTVYNTVAQVLTITNDATSTAANRIYTLTGADVTTPKGPNIVQFQYNAALSRWIIIGGQNLTATSSGGDRMCYTCDGF